MLYRIFYGRAAIITMLAAFSLFRGKPLPFSVPAARAAGLLTKYSPSFLRRGARSAG